MMMDCEIYEPMRSQPRPSRWSEVAQACRASNHSSRRQDPRSKICLSDLHCMLTRGASSIATVSQLQDPRIVQYAARATWTWLMRWILLKPCHAGIIWYGMSLWHNVISTCSLVRRSFEHKARYHTTTPLDWRKFHDESRKYCLSVFLAWSVY